MLIALKHSCYYPAISHTTSFMSYIREMRMLVRRVHTPHRIVLVGTGTSGASIIGGLLMDLEDISIMNWVVRKANGPKHHEDEDQSENELREFATKHNVTPIIVDDFVSSGDTIAFLTEMCINVLGVYPAAMMTSIRGSVWIHDDYIRPEDRNGWYDYEPDDDSDSAFIDKFKEQFPLMFKKDVK